MAYRVLAVLTVSIWAAAAGHVAAQTIGQPERYTAWAVSMGTVAGGANKSIDFWVDRWSTPQERELLITTFLEKGPDALLRELQKQKAKGRMRIPGWMGPDPHQARLGWDIKYAWQEPLPEGGRRVFLAFDRYIGFEEVRQQPRTIDYPFSLVELRLNKAGEGEGKYSVATKISFDKKKKVIELENYSSEPVRLQNVKAEPKN